MIKFIKQPARRQDTWPHSTVPDVSTITYEVDSNEETWPELIEHFVNISTKFALITRKLARTPACMLDTIIVQYTYKLIFSMVDYSMRSVNTCPLIQPIILLCTR